MRPFALVLAAGAVLLPLAAAAQDAPPPPPPAQAQRPPMTRDAFVARATERFRRMDANGDGVVTQDEFGAYMQAQMAKRMGGGDGAAPPVPHAGRGGGMGAMMFQRLDTDGDGKVTLAEAQAAAAQQFDRMDANHDGQLTPDEMHGGWGGGGGGHGHWGNRDQDAPPPPPPQD